VWAGQYRDHHELAEHVDPGREAYLSVFDYPPGPYGEHFRRAGQSPRGYAGPAGCPHLLFDVDRLDDLPAALTATRLLVRHLLARYGPAGDDAVGVYFSGRKGFHVTLAMPAGIPASPAVPATAKHLALALAGAAGVAIDAGCYDHQRIVRLPNSRHPRTGLHKRPLTHEELFRLPLDAILGLARCPVESREPAAGGPIELLEQDWLAAAAALPAVPPPQAPRPHYPAVPQKVRDFIGFRDLQDPGRAVTVFRHAADLARGYAESGIAAVIEGLLAPVARETGLPEAEVRRQIAGGIRHGLQKGGHTP
jgi:hypothetical protein